MVKMGLFSHFTNQTFCDVTFRFKTDNIGAHRCIVSIFCQKIFSQGELEVNHEEETVIDLTTCFGGFFQDLEENFKSFLVFLYTGRIDLTKENLYCLKEISEKFCCDILIKSIHNFEAENEKAFKCKTEVEKSKKTENRLTEKKCNNKRLNNEHYPTTQKTESMDKSNEKMKNETSCKVGSENTELRGENCDNNLRDLKITPNELKAQKNKTQLSRMFVCNTCGQKFIHVNKFLKHIDEYKHIDVACSICDFKGESQQDLVNHLECHRTPGKPYHCQVCSMKFRSKRELTVHLPKHSDSFGYMCTICNKGFKWKQVWKVHMSSHSESNILLCSICGFSTKHKSTMETHQNRHTGKDFVCTVTGCSFKTARKQNLKQHIKNHNNERPYKCDKCEKTFSQKKNLTRHLALHEKSQVPLECPRKECSYTNHRKDKLMHHISTKHPELVEKGDKNVDMNVDTPETPSTTEISQPLPNWKDSLDSEAIYSDYHVIAAQEIPNNVNDICLEYFDNSEVKTGDDSVKADAIDKRPDIDEVDSGEHSKEESNTLNELPPTSSGICLDPIKYVNPPNRTVTQSLATCPTTTKPMDMASSMGNIASSFLQGFI